MNTTVKDKAKFSKKAFMQQPEEFRISAIISDGAWYDIDKWQKYAGVDKDTLNDWIDKKLKAGELIKGDTGAQSYRFPLESVLSWHDRNDFDVNEQIVDFIFPARVWGGKTEVEGFLDAPLREIGITTIKCSTKVAQEITERLRGIARVREVKPGEYRARSLDSSYVKKIVQEIFESHEEKEVEKVYCRVTSMRREMVDFPRVYAEGIVNFYKEFGKFLVRNSGETIKIFLDGQSDIDTQVIIWVLEAIEKYDQSTCVPFAGYLSTVMSKWPYGLPNDHLGKDLAQFQRSKKKAIKDLKVNEEDVIPAGILADKMGMDIHKYWELEEKHKVWISCRSATSLAWEDNGSEKSGSELMKEIGSNSSDVSAEASHRLSVGIINAALESGEWESAYATIGQMDSYSVDVAALSKLSPKFVKALAKNEGIRAE